MALSSVRMSDELHKKTLDELPRAISISALLRWAIHAAVDNQTEFNKAVREDKQMVRVQEFMAGRMEKLFAKK